MEGKFYTTFNEKALKAIVFQAIYPKSSVGVFAGAGRGGLYKTSS